MNPRTLRQMNVGDVLRVYYETSYLESRETSALHPEQEDFEKTESGFRTVILGQPVNIEEGGLLGCLDRHEGIDRTELIES